MGVLRQWLIIEDMAEIFVTHFLTTMESTRIWTTTTDVLFFNAVIKIATLFGLRKWMFFQSSGSTSS